MPVPRNIAIAGLAAALLLFTVQPGSAQETDGPELSSKCDFMLRNFQRDYYADKEPRAMAMSANGRSCAFYAAPMPLRADTVEEDVIQQCERPWGDTCEVIMCVGC